MTRAIVLLFAFTTVGQAFGADEICDPNALRAALNEAENTATEILGSGSTKAINKQPYPNQGSNAYEEKINDHSAKSAYLDRDLPGSTAREDLVKYHIEKGDLVAVSSNKSGLKRAEYLEHDCGKTGCRVKFRDVDGPNPNETFWLEINDQTIKTGVQNDSEIRRISKLDPDWKKKDEAARKVIEAEQVELKKFLAEQKKWRDEMARRDAPKPPTAQQIAGKEQVSKVYYTLEPKSSYVQIKGKGELSTVRGKVTDKGKGYVEITTDDGRRLSYKIDDLEELTDITALRAKEKADKANRAEQSRQDALALQRQDDIEDARRVAQDAPYTPSAQQSAISKLKHGDQTTIEVLKSDGNGHLVMNVEYSKHVGGYELKVKDGPYKGSTLILGSDGKTTFTHTVYNNDSFMAQQNAFKLKARIPVDETGTPIKPRTPAQATSPVPKPTSIPVSNATNSPPSSTIRPVSPNSNPRLDVGSLPIKQNIQITVQTSAGPQTGFLYKHPGGQMQYHNGSQWFDVELAANGTQVKIIGREKSYQILAAPK